MDDNTKDVLLVLIGAGVTLLATRLGHGYAIALTRRNDRKDAYLEFLDACEAIERWFHASEIGAGIPPGPTLSELVNVQLAIATAKVGLFHHGGMRSATISFQAAQDLESKMTQRDPRAAVARQTWEQSVEAFRREIAAELSATTWRDRLGLPWRGLLSRMGRAIAAFRRSVANMWRRDALDDDPAGEPFDLTATSERVYEDIAKVRRRRWFRRR